MRGEIHKYLQEALKDADDFPHGLRVQEESNYSTSVLHFFFEKNPKTGYRKVILDHGEATRDDLEYIAGCKIEYEAQTGTFFGMRMDKEALLILAPVLGKFGVTKARWRDPMTNQLHEHDIV